MGICGVCGGKGLLWVVKRKGFGKRKAFGLRKGPVFSAYEKPTDKEKLFLSTAKFQFRTTPKLTCSHKFHPRKPTVSLKYNNPFSKLRNLASAVR